MDAPAIQAAGLTKVFRSGVVGLDGVDLAVGRGERLGFLGPNGAGKTTFIRLALGLLRPTAGAVRLMGRDVAGDRLAALAEAGYLPGDLGLVRGLTGRRTLEELGRLHPRPPVLRDELLRVFDLDDAVLRRRIRDYSRGMRQKLGLVLALQHDPPLVVLDEPTSGLDPVMQGRLLEWLEGRARAGRTVFFSSHVLAEVEELCDRVAMVRQGRLLLVRSVEEIRGARVRSVEVSFAAPVDPEAYRVDGIGSRVEVAGATHRFTFRGDPAPLLAALGRLDVRDVAIQQARLEDVFRALYAEEEAEVPA
ncbi:MAG: ABC transporter ATP-binding protein [Actinomycetota bacterium]